MVALLPINVLRNESTTFLMMFFRHGQEESCWPDLKMRQDLLDTTNFIEILNLDLPSFLTDSGCQVNYEAITKIYT